MSILCSVLRWVFQTEVILWWSWKYIFIKWELYSLERTLKVRNNFFHLTFICIFWNYQRLESLTRMSKRSNCVDVAAQIANLKSNPWKRSALHLSNFSIYSLLISSAYPPTSPLRKKLKEWTEIILIIFMIHFPPIEVSFVDIHNKTIKIFDLFELIKHISLWFHWSLKPFIKLNYWTHLDIAIITIRLDLSSAKRWMGDS